MPQTTDLLPPDIYGRRYTAEEFAQLHRPPCPVCGTPVEIDRIYATMNRQEQETLGDFYMAGRWSCPRGCNPLTSERLHESYKMQSRDEGFWFECSCGHEELIVDEAQRIEVFAQHKPGTWA